MNIDDFYLAPFDKFMRAYQRDVARKNNLPQMGGPSSSGDVHSTQPHGLDASEKKQLSGLQARQKRLQPIDVGAVGSRRIAGNPYSINTEGLLQGLSGLAEGVINKKREQRLGDIAPDLEHLLAKKEAGKKQAPQKEPPNPLNSAYVEQGMRLISQGFTNAGIKALEKGGLDQSGILEALPKEKEKASSTGASSSAVGTDSATKTPVSKEKTAGKTPQGAGPAAPASTNNLDQQTKAPNPAKLRQTLMQKMKKAGGLPPDMDMSLQEEEDDNSMLFQ